MMRTIYFIEDVISRSMLAIVAICVFAQVISRYIFSTSLVWTQEVASMAMLWAVYTGAAVAIRKRFHIRIIVLIRLAPRWLAILSVIIGDILFLLFCFLMLRVGFIYLELLANRQHLSPALRIDQIYPHSIIVIAYALFVLHTVLHYIDWWRSDFEGLPGLDEVEGTTAALDQDIKQ